MRKIFAAGLLLCTAQVANADITIGNVYIPPVPPASMAYAAYMTLANSGSETRTVVGVGSTSFGMVHLHQTMIKDGMSSMKSMTELVIAPGQTVTFEPGGIHIMLMKPVDEAIAAGIVPLTLLFKNGESIEVTALVRAIN